VVLVVLSLGMFMTLLDLTIVTSLAEPG